MAAMEALACSGAPLDRFMVGTGAAALADAVALTRKAVDLGFAGALVLPPFYYKGVLDQDLAFFFDALVKEVDRSELRLYLYQFPQNTGIVFSSELIGRLRAAFPQTFVGLKDSSGDMKGAEALARAQPGFDVFPSTEEALPQVADRVFAGIISATLNVTAPLASVRRGNGDDGSVPAAIAIRAALSSVPLVGAVRWALADLTGDTAWEACLPPLSALSSEHKRQLITALAGTPYETLRGQFRSVEAELRKREE
jgi:4-hydroxy-tetrahydrodipicolinate synthase